MSVFRSRAGLLASLALTWQVFAAMLVPTAACRQPAIGSVAGGDMAACPMHHAPGETCPMHAGAAEHRDGGPTIVCSASEVGFMALLGAIGVMPAAATAWTLHQAGDVFILSAPSSLSLARTPVAPPPRA